MHIAWKYLDTKSAAVNVLLEYQHMERIMETTPDKIEEKEGRMCDPHSAIADGMPHAPDPKAGEALIVTAIDNINNMLCLYQQAEAYMAWVAPAMKMLTDRERHILGAFYMSGSRHSGANRQLQEELGYRERQIDRFRAQALSRFSRLLFGI